MSGRTEVRQRPITSASSRTIMHRPIVEFTEHHRSHVSPISAACAQVWVRRYGVSVPDDDGTREDSLDRWHGKQEITRRRFVARGVAVGGAIIWSPQSVFASTHTTLT